MNSSNIETRLEALGRAVGRSLEDKRHRYFDPAHTIKLFETFAVILGQLREDHPDLYDDVVERPVPTPRPTTDNEGRGIVDRHLLEQLAKDIAYCLDLLPPSSTVEIPAMTATREGVFFAGQYLDALRLVAGLLSTASTEVLLIDGYVDASVLDILAQKDPAVSVKILTTNPKAGFAASARAFAKQHGAIEVRTSTKFHDRFLILDNKDVYHFGASIKDLGNRGFMFSRVEEPDVLNSIKHKVGTEWAAATPLPL